MEATKMNLEQKAISEIRKILGDEYVKNEEFVKQLKIELCKKTGCKNLARICKKVIECTLILTPLILVFI